MLHNNLLIGFGRNVNGEIMSRRRRRRESFMPISGAGLIRFFEEEIRGIRVSPIHVIIMAIALMAFAILGNLGFLKFIK